jgi:phage-related tail protein
MTLRELASKHGCSHGRIAQRAKAAGWSRDLLPAIKQATDKRLIELAVHGMLNSEANRATQGLTNAVLLAAEVNTQIILGHRDGLNRITRIKEALLDQIEQAAQHLPDLAKVIEMVRQPDDSGVDKANDALRKAMGRSGLVDDLKKLAEIDERVRKGEREAFSITGPADGDDGQPKRKRVTVDFIDVVAK